MTRPRCEAIATWAWNGPVDPRPCKIPARPGERFCGVHLRLRAEGRVDVRDGGFCLWCVKPARSYASPHDARITIALCDGCATALVRAIQRGRHAA